MQRVEKAWGYELIFALTDSYVGKIIHIAAGHRLSRQHHVAEDETLLVESGQMDLRGGDHRTGTRRSGCAMCYGDVCRITPGTVHRMVGVTDVDVIEVSTPQFHDVVRLEDDYRREGTTTR